MCWSHWGPRARYISTYVRTSLLRRGGLVTGVETTSRRAFLTLPRVAGLKPGQGCNPHRCHSCKRHQGRWNCGTSRSDNQTRLHGKRKSRKQGNTVTNQRTLDSRTRHAPWNFLEPMGEEFITLVKKVAYTGATIRANQGSVGVSPNLRSSVAVADEQIINSVNPVIVGR